MCYGEKMKTTQKISLFLMRVLLGWMYLYAGVTKVMKADWTAGGYIKGVLLYQWMLQPEVLSIVNFMNKWGLTLLGISLILGVGMRISVRLGVLLMILYYIPVMKMPYVDQHVVYSLSLVLLLVFGADKVWGMRGWLEEKRWVKKSFLKWLV